MTPELIVSLTSIRPRLELLPLVVQALCSQTMPPDEIIIWLGEELRTDEGGELERRLKTFGSLVQVRYTADEGPFTKLLPALRTHPGAVIVTADDDILVPEDWLERLFRTHQDNPRAILCYRGRVIRLNDDESSFLPYRRWPLHRGEAPSAPSFWLLPTGIAGILYPPAALSDQVHNCQLRQSLCPYADDLWFKAMAIINHIPTIKVRGGYDWKRFALLETAKLDSLWNINKRQNDDQWASLSQHFCLRDILLNHNRIM